MVEPELVKISRDRRVHVEHDFEDGDLYLILVQVFVSIKRISKLALHVICKWFDYVVAFHADLLVENVLHHTQNNVGLYQLKDTILELMRLVINRRWYKHFGHRVPVNTHIF